jgi:hypothetical protein
MIENPAVAALANGGFVATFDSWAVIGPDPFTDNDMLGVVGQCFGPKGGHRGDWFQANRYTQGDQDRPSVAGLADGRLVVVFSSYRTADPGTGVYGRFVNAGGRPIGGDFLIEASNDPYLFFSSSVAALPDGGFVVIWDGDGKDGSVDVFGRRYGADGKPRGHKFQVNTHTWRDQGGSSVAALADGGFVVTWTSLGQDGLASGVSAGIFGQRFARTGARRGGEFRVNTTTRNHQSDSSVAGLADGGFVVTWTSWHNDRANSDLYTDVYGQRFGRIGARRGGEFRVNTNTRRRQEQSSVAALADGGFVVTWSSERQVTGSDIYGQRYVATGRPLSGEFKANTASMDALQPSAAGLAGGGFVVIWNAYDGGSTGVFGQRFE